MQAIRWVGSMSSNRARWLSIFIFLASFSMIQHVLFSQHDDSTTSDEVAAAEVPVAVNVATPTPDDVSLDEAMTAETSIHLDPVTIVCWLPTAWTTPGYEALGNNRIGEPPEKVEFEGKRARPKIFPRPPDSTI